MNEAQTVEIKVFLKDGKYKKEVWKTILKVFSIAFAIAFLYYLQSFGMVFPSIGKSLYNAVFVFLMIAAIASAVSLLYAVGSGFQKGNGIEKNSAKTRIIFNGDGVSFVKGFNVEEKSWSDFAKIKETVDGFYIYENGGEKLFIPDYVFRSNTHRNDFRNVWKKHLGERAKVKI
ncbi:MAG TPA: YcxB family protein [Pyrinomonadaceae bacterium]|nr:YcxB family protein [Pyrinomonadaceae bacterium]